MVDVLWYWWLVEITIMLSCMITLCQMQYGLKVSQQYTAFMNQSLLILLFSVSCYEKDQRPALVTERSPAVRIYNALKGVMGRPHGLGWLPLGMGWEPPKVGWGPPV